MDGVDVSDIVGRQAKRAWVTCGYCETTAASGADEAEAARLWNVLPRAERIANTQRAREEALGGAN